MARFLPSQEGSEAPSPSFCWSSIRQIKIKIKLVASFAFGYLVRGHTQLVNRSGCDSVIFIFIVTARAEDSLGAFYDVFVLLLFHL